MNKVIQVFEHESLKVSHDGLTKKHLALLDKFRGDREDDDFNYYSLIHNGVKFKQYVGVLCVGDLQIEVLPKADKHSGDDQYGVWHQRLLMMLKCVYKLKINTTQKTEQKIVKSQILDVFIQRFLDEVEILIHKGLIKSYRREEGNMPALKGRLVMSKHIVKNMIHKERFYVNYTTYDRNHICNRIIRKALEIIPDIATSPFTVNRSKTLLFEFPELKEVVVNENMFAKLVYDRKSEDYRDCMELARLILLHYMPNLSHNKQDKVLALMFDMNKLWEEYVFIKLRRALPLLNVTAQNRHPFWIGDSGTKIIKPDVVIRDNTGACVAVFDTKWKCPKENKPSDSDLKQMYVYHKYWNTPNTVLLYPGEDKKVTGKYNNEDLQCSMIFLPIDNADQWCSKNSELYNILSPK